MTLTFITWAAAIITLIVHIERHTPTLEARASACACACRVLDFYNPWPSPRPAWLEEHLQTGERIHTLPNASIAVCLVPTEPNPDGREAALEQAIAAGPVVRRRLTDDLHP